MTRQLKVLTEGRVREKWVQSKQIAFYNSGIVHLQKSSIMVYTIEVTDIALF